MNEEEYLRHPIPLPPSPILKEDGFLLHFLQCQPALAGANSLCCHGDRQDFPVRMRGTGAVGVKKRATGHVYRLQAVALRPEGPPLPRSLGECVIFLIAASLWWWNGQKTQLDADVLYDGVRARICSLITESAAASRCRRVHRRII